MKRKLTWGASLALTGLLTACSSMSGLDGSSSFGCKAAPGVSCVSMSGVYQNANAGALPFQKEEAAALVSDEKRPYAGVSRGEKVSPRDMNAAFSGMPVRQPPLVLRVWTAPFEDESGDLHDQSYFYTMVHSGRWMIEANRGNISNQFRPVYPLNKQTQQSQEPSPSQNTPVPQEKGPLITPGNYEGVVTKPDL